MLPNKALLFKSIAFLLPIPRMFGINILLGFGHSQSLASCIFVGKYNPNKKGSLWVEKGSKF